MTPSSPPRVVYLDQNIVSGMARGGDLRVVALKDDLMRRVRSGRLVVPRSTAHQYESELDTRIFDAVMGLAEELSDGVRFLTFSEVLDKEIYAALDVQLGRAECEPWRRAFRRDPREPRDNRYLDGIRIAVRSSLPPPQDADAIRLMKTAFAAGGIGAASKPGQTFTDVVQQEATSAVEALFSDCAPERLEEATLSGDVDEYLKVGARHSRLTGMAEYWIRNGGESGGLRPFLLSPDVLSIPPIDVIAHMFAWKRKQGAAVEEGDIFDTEHMALAIPYTDAVVTEKRWAEAIRQTKVASKYGTNVFTMKTLDEFTAWLDES